MNKMVVLLASAASVAFVAPVFAADKETFKSETKIEKDSKGNYNSKSSTSTTDAAGTTSSMEKKVSVDVDSDGSREKTVKTEETTDPKGLMNKTTTKIKDTEKTDKNGNVETSHKKTVNGKTVEEDSTKH